METTLTQVFDYRMAASSYAALDGLQDLFEQTSEKQETREEALMNLFQKMQAEHRESEARYSEEKNLLEGRVALLSKQLELNKVTIKRLETDNEVHAKKIKDLDSLSADLQKQIDELFKTMPGQVTSLKESIHQLSAKVDAVNSGKASSEESTLAISEARQKLDLLEKQLTELATTAKITRSAAFTAATTAGVSSDLLKTYNETEKASLASLEQFPKELEEAHQKIAHLERQLEERESVAYDQILVKRSAKNWPLPPKNVQAIQQKHRECNPGYHLDLNIRNGQVTVFTKLSPSRKIGDRIETQVTVWMLPPTPLTEEELER